MWARRLVLVLIVLGIALVTAVATGDAARARPTGATTSTSTTAPAVERPDIIPRPNQGVAPEDAGDRGGTLQVLTFVVMTAAVAGIGGLIVRSSRRARAERGSPPPP